MAVPTPEAWAYFMEHHDAIRGVCQVYLPRRHMEIPNSRIVIKQSQPGDLPGEGLFTDTEMRAKVPLKVTHTLSDFDAAVVAKDSVRLTSIMNRAWLALPESQSIYGEPGVTQMCNLLDCTIDGFFDDGSGEGVAEDDEAAAF